MQMQISDLLDMDELQKEIDAKYVTARTHPDFPELVILNYSDKCAYDSYWTSITRKTRGLIYNSTTGEVLARPFEKFFNYGQEGSSLNFDLDAPILGAFDKMDGSLGIKYTTPKGEVQVSTRGSFSSDQALWANTYLTQNNVSTESGFTELWEIIYPGNKIVVDYGDREELVLLGKVDNITGEFIPNSELQLPARTFREALELPDRKNAEGLVIWLDAKTAVKLKQDDYIYLHRIVSNLSQKEIWRQLYAGTYEGFVVQLPDEFYSWADLTAAALRKEFDSIAVQAGVYFFQLQEARLASRKEQALWVQECVPGNYRGYVFALLDGKSIEDSIWRVVEPVGANPMKVIVE